MAAARFDFLLPAANGTEKHHVPEINIHISVTAPSNVFHCIAVRAIELQIDSIHNIRHKQLLFL